VKPLLVGEANPYGGDLEFALYPYPPGCSGDRLCRLVMELDPDDYLERFDRANLCPSRWSMREARPRAAAIRRERDAPIVLLGAKVCAAFEVDFVPFRLVGDRTAGRGPRDPVYVVLPHPSGLSRAWNAPGAYARARGVLREAGALP
jgi:hypothetical protein